MLLNQSQLNNLPVYTKNKDFLGRVLGFQLDGQTHQVINYYIGSSSLLKKLLGEQKQLIISYQDVLSLSEEKMVVQDSVIKEENLSPKEVLTNQPLPTLQKEL